MARASRTQKQDRIEHADSKHVAAQHAGDADGQHESERNSTHPDFLRLIEEQPHDRAWRGTEHESHTHFAFALTREDVPEGVLRRWVEGRAPHDAATVPPSDRLRA